MLKPYWYMINEIIILLFLMLLLDVDDFLGWLLTAYSDISMGIIDTFYLNY